MLESILIVYIILSALLFVLCVLLMEDKPWLAVPLVMVGVIFSTMCVFGFFQVDVPMMVYNSTSEAYEPSLLSVTDQYVPYVWVYFLFVLIYGLVFVKAMFNILVKSVDTGRK